MIDQNGTASEIECRLIGAMLIDNSIIDDVIEIAKPCYFCSANKTIVDAIICIRSSGDIADAVSVAIALDCNDTLARLSSAVSETASTVNAMSYARLVRDYHLRRELTKKLAEARGIVDSAATYDDAVSGINGCLSELTETDDSEIVIFDSIIKDRLIALDQRSSSDNQIFGMTTGWQSVDDVIMGVDPAALWVVGARPSMGKTVFMLDVCAHRIKAGDNILCFSVEMSKEQLVDRMIIAAAGIDAGAFRAGNMSGDDWPKLTAAVTSISKKNQMHIVDKPAIDIDHLIAIARKMNRKKPIDFVCVDYLSIVTASGCKTKLEEVSKISQKLKGLAKELSCPVLALAQLNRGVESRNDKRPCSADLRESGQIEQDADIISFLYRDEVYDPDTPNAGIAEVITTKNRHGKTGTAFLRADLRHQRFLPLPTSFSPAEKEIYTPYSKK